MSVDVLSPILKVVLETYREAMMPKKRKTTWEVVGWDSEIRIVEKKASESDVAVRSYEEAKRDALEKLQSHIRPYRDRIEELENDRFLEKGALTPIRVWRRQFGRTFVVTAKTKKRAAELVGETRYGFNSDWYECEGDDRYDFARREGVWIPQYDASDSPTGEFHRCLTRDEAAEILTEYARPYRRIDPHDLLPLLDKERADIGTTDDGVAYEITTDVWRFGGTSDAISVLFRISDGSGVIWIPSVVIERDLPKETADWKAEGF